MSDRNGICVWKEVSMRDKRKRQYDNGKITLPEDKPCYVCDGSEQYALKIHCTNYGVQKVKISDIPRDAAGRLADRSAFDVNNKYDNSQLWPVFESEPVLEILEEPMRRSSAIKDFFRNLGKWRMAA